MTTFAVTDPLEARLAAARARSKWRAVVFGRGPSSPIFGQAFMRLYLPHYMLDDQTREFIDPADWHPAFFWLVFGTMGSGGFHAYLAPRGWAKSTTGTLALPLAVLGLSGRDDLPYDFVRKHYLWIVQDEANQAKQTMLNILAETETNPAIREDFPHLVPALGRHKRPVADRDDDVVFAGGQRLQALGTGQKIRGRRHRQFRPDLLLVDDLENDEHVLTKYQRDKLDRWFSGALIPALAKNADAHVFGTLLHHDALLARLRTRGGFHFHQFDAFGREKEPCPDHPWLVDDGTPRRESDPSCDLCDDKGTIRPSTWAGYRDPKWVATTKRRVGRKVWAREYLHQVTDEDEKLFPSKFFQWRDPHFTRDGDWRVRIGVDPSSSEKETSDPRALVVVAKKRGEPTFDVLHVWQDRVRFGALKDRVVAAWQQFGGIIVVETVQVQEWLKQELEDLGAPVRAGTTGRKDKVTRAEPVALKYEQGFVYHALGLRDSDFEDQLDEFPAAEHDDLVDALVYAMRDLQEGEGEIKVAGAVRQGRKPAKEDMSHDPRFS